MLQPSRKLKLITAEWLAPKLDVIIRSLFVQPIVANNSIIARLFVTYGEATQLPDTFILKFKEFPEFGQTEISVYTIFPPLEGLVPCYYSGYDDALETDTLILADVSDTHVLPVTINDLKEGKGVPSEKHLHLIVDRLADWHRHWWENRRSYPPPWFFWADRDYADRMEAYHNDWEDFDKDSIPDDWVTLYEKALLYVPSLWKKYIEARFMKDIHLTLIHGDCYFSQFFVNDEHAYIADFDSIAYSIPTDDLVFLMATFWTREQRAQHEMAILKRYHQRLNQADYSWDDLLHDYRMMLLFRVFHPVWDANNGSSEAYWKTKMQCLIHAYQDWDVEANFCGNA